MKIRDAIVAAALLLAMAGAVVAAPAPSAELLSAEAAYHRGDYATALRLLKPLAEKGDPNAQYNLAILYYEGRGVPRNYAEAAKWYRKAADQGDVSAQYNLGNMYKDGQGVPQDYAEAVKWFRKAAEQGDAKAATNLAVRYASGQGVPKSQVEALKWFRVAADQGLAAAQGAVALIFSLDEGVPHNYVAAYMWFTLAAAGNFKDAIAKRDIVAKYMTPAQIAEAQKLARDWKPKKEYTLPSCTTPVGDWAWFEGSEISFLENHTATNSAAPGQPGTWSQDGTKVTVRWPRWNSTDVPVLSSDGQELTGLYGATATQSGFQRTSTRRTACK